jgi:hypothetical protein
MSKIIKLSNNTQDYLYINDVPLIIGDGNGPTGPTGEQGPIGPSGESIVGPTGEQGPIGPSGESIVGPTGEQGPIGPSGESIVGPTGPTGINSNINYTISTILTNQQYILYNDVSDCDIYQVDTSENIITIVLPEINSLTNQQRKHVFSDVGGKLNINHLIIETSQNSTNTIVGENSVTLTINYSSITIISNTINNWIII